MTKQYHPIPVLDPEGRLGKAVAYNRQANLVTVVYGERDADGVQVRQFLPTDLDSLDITEEG